MSRSVQSKSPLGALVGHFKSASTSVEQLGLPLAVTEDEEHRRLTAAI
jgi:hypothetical protein